MGGGGGTMDTNYAELTSGQGLEAEYTRQARARTGFWLKAVAHIRGGGVHQMCFGFAPGQGFGVGQSNTRRVPEQSVRSSSVQNQA